MKKIVLLLAVLVVGQACSSDDACYEEYLVLKKVERRSVSEAGDSPDNRKDWNIPSILNARHNTSRSGGCSTFNEGDILYTVVNHDVDLNGWSIEMRGPIDLLIIGDVYTSNTNTNDNALKANECAVIRVTGTISSDVDAYGSGTILGNWDTTLGNADYSGFTSTGIYKDSKCGLDGTTFEENGITYMYQSIN